MKITPQERGYRGGSARARVSTPESRKETGRRGGITAGINKRLKRGIEPTPEERLLLNTPMKIVVPDMDVQHVGTDTRPRCFSAFTNPRAPGSIDDGRSCLCWKREGEWIGRYNCEGCARLDRARSLGIINGARK